MKIVLFQDGRSSEVISLPGEAEKAELSDLLGGEIKIMPFSDRLALVTREDGETLDLPVRYRAHGLSKEPVSILGDCAVVAVGPNGKLRDVGPLEILAAEACLQPVRFCGALSYGKEDE